MHYTCVFACLWLCVTENFLLNWLGQTTTPETTFPTPFEKIIVAMAENCEWANFLLSCDWRWLAKLPYVVICVVNSEFAVACRDMSLTALLWSLYLRETRFSGIEVIRKAGVIEQKRQNRKKKEKETRKEKTIKMNDWLTQLVWNWSRKTNELDHRFKCREIQLIEPNSQFLGLLGLLWGNLERNLKDRVCWGKDFKKYDWDRDYSVETDGITGLRENSGRDTGI